MSDIIRVIPFEQLLNWALDEYETKGSVFSIKKEKFYKNTSGKYFYYRGEKLSSPIGVASGPHTQLAQNIVAAYLSGSRFIELKTVQEIDGNEMRKKIKKPCINAADECYNVEWSTELTVREAEEEYIKAWILIHVLSKEFGISDERDFAFNMSIGYDLEGIRSEKMDLFIECMKDARHSQKWRNVMNVLSEKIKMFKNIDAKFINSISSNICNSVTLSTLHGTNPQEIETIGKYLLVEQGLNTTIKLNPTVLGHTFARKTLNDMGYDYIQLENDAFKDDLQYYDAVTTIRNLHAEANKQNLYFSVKLTNTLPVKNTGSELSGNEMYMSGRALYPLSVNAAYRLADEFDGKINITYCGGVDYFNVKQLLETGVFPLTFCTTILKPGGYLKIYQLANETESMAEQIPSRINVSNLHKIAREVTSYERYVKNTRKEPAKKHREKLPLFDCFKAPCKQDGCPINQQVPVYIKLASEKNFDEAFKVIAVDNALPSITSVLCNHKCQGECMRYEIDDHIEIRNIKNIVVENAQDKFINNLPPIKLKTQKSVAIIGAGCAGIAAAIFLRRNGIGVTVFEKNNKPFGMVSYIIPSFRIAEETIERDYQLAVKLGVNFKFGVKETYEVKTLLKDYEYVIVATGAWGKSSCPIKSDCDNLVDALSFLEQSKKTNRQVMLGRKVAIIGGGDVAMDCARAANRSPEVTQVTIIYRRTKEFMPASHDEINYCENEEIEFLELLSPVSYDGKTLVCEEMELAGVDETGRAGIKSTGKTKEFEFNSVIYAVGSSVDTTHFGLNGFARNEKGLVKVNEVNETSIAGVYIAGDCKKGPSTIVSAISDAKVIAKDILRKLGLENDFINIADDSDVESLYLKKGTTVDKLMDENEGYRCLHCEQLCETCVDVCPNRANISIDIEGFKNRSQILHIDGMCNECGNCAVFCPYDGRPYKDKPTLFATEDDFNNSTNAGFLPLVSNVFKVRNEKGEVFDHAIGDKKASPEFEALMKSISKYMLLQ